METLKKLRDEMLATKHPVIMEFADTLDAYIKAQESAEPVAEILVGINKHVVDVKRQKTDLREGWHKLYAAPPPREPISRDALSDLIRSVRYCETTLDEFAKAVGIEVKP